MTAADRHISVRRAETRTRLVDAATKVFAEKGVRAASVEEICEQAGFTRGAFYSNYAHKNELVEEILDRDVTNLTGTLETLMQEEDFLDLVRAARDRESRPLWDLLFDIIGAFMVIQRMEIMNNGNLPLVMNEIRLSAARDPNLHGVYRAYSQRLHSAMWPTLEAAARLGGYRWVYDGPTVMKLLDSQYEALLLASLLTPYEIDTDEFCDEVSNPFIALVQVLLEPDEEVMAQYAAEAGNQAT